MVALLLPTSSPAEARRQQRVALPGVEVGLPAVTPKDEADLAFGRKAGVDLVAASFVTSGADIRMVRNVAGDVPVIAKIERAEAYANLGDILDEADGAMVARGDLGVELGFEPLPRVQKGDHRSHPRCWRDLNHGHGDARVDDIVTPGRHGQK